MQQKAKRALVIKISLVLAVAAAVALAFWFGYSLANKQAREAFTNIHPVRENNQAYKFISPLLFYDFGDAKKYFENKDLENKINNYIQTQYQNKNADSISVSVRDYAQNNWAGVNQNAQYHPGSMLKVIIMMGYFREAEVDPDVLKKSLVYTSGTNQQSNAVPFSLQTNLTIGQSYPTEYLLKDMIDNSDNGAENLLIDNVDSSTLNLVYKDLSIQSPDDVPENAYTISADQYINFIRILYNSTYLDEQYSEEALSIMSQASYQDGIVSGVPAGTVVAQKYGERVSSPNGTLDGIELSNCGIVYAPNHPYSICVMTKKPTNQANGAADEKALANIIKDISSIVYNSLVNK